MVQLWSGSNPEGEGTVWIQAGGELVIEGEYTFSGSGFWQFDKGNTVSGDGDLIIEGDGRNYRRMKVNTSAEVLLDNGQDFNVRNARIEYVSGGSVSVVDGSSFDIYDVQFDGPAGKVIYTDGSVRSSIRNSEFLDNRTGVSLHQKGPLKAVTIINSLFQSASTAGVAFSGFSADNFGRTPSITSCIFSGCEKGVDIDNLLSVNISNSSFTSSEEDQFAIYAQDCESLFVRDCSVIGYDIQPDKGAVELEYVTARFSGGEYSANTVAIHDQSGSSLTFSNCVDVIGNCYGIATSEVVGEITTLSLNGMSLLNNSIGIYGGSGIITSSGVNSFQMPEKAECESFGISTARLISMDVNRMQSPVINLDGNHWMDARGATLTTQPDPSAWFCIQDGPNNWCTTTTVIPTNNIRSQGCGSGPCESPKTCDYYCELYPEDPACFTSGGGGGLFKFSATPNPSGGYVSLSQLPEEGGLLHVFDSRGTLLKVLHLAPSTHQSIELYDLPSGIYTLQLVSEADNELSAVRLVIAN